MGEQETPQICDYENSTYRTDFWVGQGREYEDRVERIAIKRLLPPTGQRIIEVGAGFGRLKHMYDGYDQIVLFDYSRSQLEYAREAYGDDGLLYVAGDIYNIPFAPGLFDAVTMIRVLHHMQNPREALQAIRSIIRQNGIFILEFANKANIKSILRWLLKRQDWNPFTPEPVEFVPLNYDFHPEYVKETLREVGFVTDRLLTVSHYRIGVLKKLVPTGILVAMDSMAQLTGNWWQLTPSVFTRNTAAGESPSSRDGAFWRCPRCRSLQMEETDTGVTCTSCSTSWAKRNGIYDFKEPADN